MDLTQAMERVNQLAEGAEPSLADLQALANLLRETTIKQHQFEAAIREAVES